MSLLPHVSNTPIQGAAQLTHWGVIRASGADAASFLHGQLTNDFSRLGLGEARLAGYCSAKGRLLASFIAWKSGPEDILLACHASVLPATLKRLGMFVLRAKCKLTDATGEIPLFGVAGDAALVGDLPVWGKRDADGSQVIRLPDAGGEVRALVASPAAPLMPVLPLAAWQWLDVQSGVPTIEAATVEQFVPQMLNFELVGGVNFQKGCYPGQEIVARSQYRGTVKRRTFLFDVDGAATAGQEVFHSADPGQPAGMVALAAPQPGDSGASALVEVKLSAIEQGTLHLGSPQGAMLHRRELPYPLLLDADQPA
ncbi:CAF17-like 4Fe-4S cluster assembly/insertion protein YgfZ [Piscinibacter terrae]|uniref:Folate-binding protein n=1 Tax=Piscinibacter terrae TaxID=2496871 RepID=A0A3N7HKX7_9BURK|nr:folate-binding protein YgfZ [Albitalea terrae]RQP22193.1 folate-binding protein [Albitalea terrae]